MLRALAAAALTVALFAAGCVAPSTAPVGGANVDGGEREPLVIAFLDSGVNPYHATVAATTPGAIERLADDVGATRIQLATAGDYAARIDADKEFLDSVETGRLYAFEGTRVMGITFGHDTPVRILDHDGEHGSAVASTAALVDPDVLLVMVQVNGYVCATEDPSCVIPSSLAAGMRWIADQDWIDVVSVSMGFPGNPALLERYDPVLQAYIEASRDAHDRGKLTLNAAGNVPNPPMFHGFNGPPWIIAVGGADASPRGSNWDNAKGMDVAANYTVFAGSADHVDAFKWRLGTSFSSPLVAGTLTRALHLARAECASCAFTQQQVRDALNASATTWAPTDWRPTQPQANETPWDLWGTTLPVVVATQVGWGHVSGETAHVIADVLLGRATVPAKDPLVVEHQRQYQAAREAWWGAVLAR